MSGLGRRVKRTLRAGLDAGPVEKARRFRRQHSPAGRSEARLATFSTTALQRLDALDKHVRRTRVDSANLAARLELLEKRTTIVADGVQELARRPVPAAGPAAPRPLVTSVIEENVVLSALQVHGDRPRVVLVLNGLATNAIFAGVRTALVTGVELARRLGRPLAVVVLEPLRVDPDAARAELAAWLTDELGAGDIADTVTLSAPERARRKDLHPDDIWIATYWATAVQIGYLCDSGLLDADHVVYLVQDWEPGFFAWGTEYALARATYDRGFHVLVNSAPLAAYVAEHAGHEIPADQVIAPQVDEARLRAAAEAWRPGSPQAPRVLFYARPSKPRNTYALGIGALRRWAEGLPEGVRPVVTFAGEPVAAPDLGRHVTVRTAGKLSFDAYYDLLAETDAGLALMHSPHPSHLALELPMAGIPTVTNALEQHRAPWVDGLRIAVPTPHALAAALTDALEDAAGRTEHRFVPLGTALGEPLDACLDALVERLPGRTT